MKIANYIEEADLIFHHYSKKERDVHMAKKEKGGLNAFKEKAISVSESLGKTAAITKEAAILVKEDITDIITKLDRTMSLLQS